MKTIGMCIAVIVAAQAAGCGARDVLLAARYPGNPKTRQEKIGKTAWIKDAVDARGDAGAAAGGEASRLLGWQKEWEGGHEGKIALEEGQSVESIARDAVEVALAGAGYDVVATKEAAGAAGPDLVLVVKVVRFAVRVTPGGMTVGIETDVQVEVTSDPDPSLFSIAARGFQAEPDVSPSPDSFRVCIEQAIINLMDDLQKVLPHY